jgi:hypothetical protein
VRKVLFTILLATLVAALVALPAAAAKPPTKPAPDPSATPAIVEPAHPISVLELPDVARTGGVEFGTKPGATKQGGGGVDPLSCGACIVTCWGVTGRNGPSDWSGHAYIYTHVDWCGNGAQLTYGTAWSSYDQSGWFRIGNTYGPWWSSGCVTCSSATATGYMLWTESIPVIGVDHNGTTWLNVHVNAYGGSSASG